MFTEYTQPKCYRRKFYPLPLSRQRHIHHLAHRPLRAMACHHHCPQARIVEGDGGGGGGVQEVQGHAVAPDGGPAFDDDKSAAGMSGKGGSGSEGVMGDETAME